MNPTTPMKFDAHQMHWFQYRDHPLLGRGDGEAYQIGFVDVCDRPYPELTRAARRFASEMYEKRLHGVW